MSKFCLDGNSHGMGQFHDKLHLPHIFFIRQAGTVHHHRRKACPDTGHYFLQTCLHIRPAASSMIQIDGYRNCCLFRKPPGHLPQKHDVRVDWKCDINYQWRTAQFRRLDHRPRRHLILDIRCRYCKILSVRYF